MKPYEIFTGILDSVMLRPYHGLMTTIEKVSESTRHITTEDGTVIEAITTLWEDGIYTVYAEWDQDQIYQTVRWVEDPLIDDATEPPSDDDIIGAYETALGW